MIAIRPPSSPVNSTTRLALILMLVLATVLAAVATLPALGDIPFTRHAQEGHMEQEWNATLITARISSRQCSPILAYSCERATIVMCPAGPDPEDLWTGVVIGTQTDAPAIVTGFAAPHSYWMSRVKSCIPVSYIP
jgi:hypothetical protein